MERCANGEMKIKDLEEELKVVGQSLQQLEVTKKWMMMIQVILTFGQFFLGQ